MRSGLVVVAALLALTGCSGSDPAPEAEPSEGPQATAPTEALAPVPSVRPRTDARILLGPDGDIELLLGKVEGDLERLSSVHVEEEIVEPRGVVTLSYDVANGRCSGELNAADGQIRFVTTADGSTLVAPLDEPGRWVETTGPTGAGPDLCEHGPGGVALGVLSGGPAAFFEPNRIGVEQVDGQRAVHFRQAIGPATVDTWIAGDGPTTRLVKAVSEEGDVRRTVHFSGFDSAGPVVPEPPADQVVGPPSA